MEPSIFIHSQLDDAGLSNEEFRLYCHIARRGNCFASIASMAETCRQRESTVRKNLKALEARGMISRTDTPGRTSQFALTPFSQWKPLPFEGTPSKQKGCRLEPGVDSPQTQGVPSRLELPHPSHLGGVEGTPIRESKEGNPRKDSELPGNPAKVETSREVLTLELMTTPAIAPVRSAKTQDSIFNAICEVTGTNSKEANGGLIGKVRKELLRANPDVTPDEIARRAANYRAIFPDADLTPGALAKHWARLGFSQGAKPSLALVDYSDTRHTQELQAIADQEHMTREGVKTAFEEWIKTKSEYFRRNGTTAANAHFHFQSWLRSDRIGQALKQRYLDYSKSWEGEKQKDDHASEPAKPEPDLTPDVWTLDDFKDRFGRCADGSFHSRISWGRFCDVTGLSRDDEKQREVEQMILSRLNAGMELDDLLKLTRIAEADRRVHSLISALKNRTS